MEPQKKILIADDDTEIVEILKNFVEKNFPTLVISTALDGIQVMQYLEKVEFYIIFLDLNLPKFDGRKVVK